MKSIYKFIQQQGVKLSLLLCIIVIAQPGTAQLNPFGAGYFRNQYLLNPAMSGLNKQLNINLGYRKEWNSIPDGPVNQIITGDYGLSDKVGVGLNLYNDKAGILSTTKAMATYSYHVSLSETRKVHLGISAGVLNRRIDKSELNGDPDDPSLASGSKTDFDADFGAAYTDNRLTVQGTFPNLVTFFKKSETDMVNKPTFFAAASYKLTVNEGENLTLEPKVAFRGVKGYDNVIDAGANLDLNNHVNLFGMYHSSKNVTVGAGLTLKEKVILTAVYTSPTTGLKTYTGGNIEIGLAILFFREK